MTHRLITHKADSFEPVTAAHGTVGVRTSQLEKVSESQSDSARV